ncbi:MAG: hypothetical protein IT531_23760 [Burkholderiales bacterium]|nr:hypothetical protein [Burkholderiales bacterium]
MLLSLCSGAVHGQTEVLPSPTIGMDSRFPYAHVSLPGAAGIDFRFVGAFAPHYPAEESHTVVLTFEWGPSVAGPWASSPDHVKTVPGGMTAIFDTGVFHGPADAPWVAIHFFAGDFLTVSGEFSHLSAVPEPSQAWLFACGVALIAFTSLGRTVRARALLALRH